MKQPFKIKEVKPNIFLLEFVDEYDMCMFFLRYQEYYESPSPKYRNKTWKVLDFMRWYSKAFGNGAFTYPIDWSGFNIPDYVIANVRDLGIPDHNDYDKAMWEAYQYCHKKVKNGKFYIIGTTKGSDALDHEIAHGMFYLHPEYKKQMTKLVKELSPDVREALEKYLSKVGYTSHVFVDEIQANMATARDFTKSTGRHWSAAITDKLIQAQKPFIELFEKYTK